jgi:ABC-type branched-subunit amino acid transport system substrate-binding protein
MAAVAKAKGGQKAKIVSSKAIFDANKMGDMSDFDPSNPIIPTGDTIKIAVVASFSGPAAANGDALFLYATWAAHDINKRGGIWVDGKKKLVQILKADHMSKPDQCKKICERMVLQEKVHVLMGTNGSNMMKIINETANKYKIIAHNNAAYSDELQDATNFSRYAFMTCYSTEQIGRGFAYFYGQKKMEKKFFILCQDYSFGHGLADGFKKGLREYYPEAQLVGEDYHKLFLTDFAPYLEKIKASGAEAVFTGDWIPDVDNLLKQARQAGIKIPFADIFLDEANLLKELGIENSKGLAVLSQNDVENPFFKTPEQIKFYKTWNNLWQTKWKTAPFNGRLYQHGTGNLGAYVMQVYWLLSVIERAKSTDPEKIIKVWEDDSYQYVSGKIIKMRACDHKAVQDFTVTEFAPPDQQKISMNIPPYYWFNDCSYYGQQYKVPASKVLPWMDQKLERCKGKNDGGE